MTDERRRVRVIMSLIYEQNQDLNEREYRSVLEGIKYEIEKDLEEEPKEIYEEE